MILRRRGGFYSELVRCYRLVCFLGLDGILLYVVGGREGRRSRIRGLPGGRGEEGGER